MKGSKFLSMFLMVSFVSLTVVGCDLITPKKKPAVKKPVVAATPAAAATPVQETKPAADMKDEPLAPGILAKVGDWSISIDDFNKRLVAVKKMVADFDDKDPQAKGMILDELIRQQLMVQEARAEKLDQNPEIVDAVKDFENSLLAQELVVKLTKDVKATEQDAKEFYNDPFVMIDGNRVSKPEFFIKPVEKKLLEIVVPTEQEAKDVLVQLLQGAEIEQKAKELSKGASAATGGDLGFLGADKPYPFEAMQKETASLKKGEMSRVFQGTEGFYLVKVADVRGGDKVTLEEVKADLIDGLTAQKQQAAVIGKLNDVATQVTVKVNSDLIGIPANKGE